jgi:hypothetical protein
VYRDDQCAVCGAALPPDHVYCREHAAEVDDRLHRIGALLHRLLDDVPALARLLDQVAPETWEYLSDTMGIEEAWPPPLPLTLSLHADQLDVDVDSEPGRVRVTLEPELAGWLRTTATAFATIDLVSVAEACSRAEGADAAY